MGAGGSTNGTITSGPLKNGTVPTINASDETIREIAEKRLVDARTESTAVDVDKRTFDGRRKADRGFTVSIGKAIAPLTRSIKRSQTLPATSNRRGDIELSADTLKTIAELQNTLKSRVRRGSITFGTTTEADLDSFVSECKVQVYGKLTFGQSPASEREICVSGGISVDKLEAEMGVTFSCGKGCKGLQDTSPNQDNFSLTRLKSGYDITCVMDGHGPNGHHASFRTVRTLPYYLFSDPNFPKNMEAALKASYMRCHSDLVGHAVQEGYDVQASGTTSVCCVRNKEHLWVAHTGDSRLVIGTETNTNIVFETKDHKPETQSERERIEKMGGEVKTFKYDDNWSVSRIFLKGKDYPGLCMTRSLGDDCVKIAGVTAEPEVNHVVIDVKKKPFLFVASDGVWEFLGSDLIIKTLSKKIPAEGSQKCLQRITKEARKRWKAEEGDYCDDITGIIMLLR